MFDTFRSILISIIFSVLSLICIVLIAATVRRILHARRYRTLDRYREINREKLKHVLATGTVQQDSKEFTASSGSLKFQAIEDVLFEFMKAPQYRSAVKELFQTLGYVKHYEKKLSSRNIITKATAIDKIGMMNSEVSTDKLIIMLKTKNVELISTSIRALSRIGTKKALIGILEHLPELYQNSLISHKTAETALRNFGVTAQPILVEYGKNFPDVRSVSSILESLSNMPVTEVSTSFAIDSLKHPDVEVRAKALKLLGRADSHKLKVNYNILMQYLTDSVWFIRLHAAKAVGNLRFKGAKNAIGNLLIDPNWQVRNAATNALIQFNDESLDIFLKALNDKDEYAKQSICEELQKSDFVNVLIGNLSQDDKDKYEKSREILKIMHTLNFSTPLMEYMHTGKDEKVKTQIRHIMLKEKEEKK